MGKGRWSSGGVITGTKGDTGSVVGRWESVSGGESWRARGDAEGESVAPAVGSTGERGETGYGSDMGRASEGISGASGVSTGGAATGQSIW